MSKLPSFQFYPGDWLKDPALRRVSKAAKGLWIDMICLSFECEERGVFATNGIAWPDGDIAAAVGGDCSENLMLLHELLEKGVCSRTAPKNGQFGAVFCRRVVRDEQLRQKRVAAGKLGGNPILLNHPVNHPVNQGANQNPTPSPSPSTSSSPSNGTLTPLTTEPSSHGKAKTAKVRRSGFNGSGRFQALIQGELPESEADFMALMSEVAEDMVNFGGRWRNRWRHNRAKCIRMLQIFAGESKQKIIDNPGGYMNDLWEKRMA